MAKIFIIGKSNVELQGINKYLSDQHDVQICVDNFPLVKSLLKIKQPDLIIVSLIGFDIVNTGIFSELKTNYSRTHILCIGTENEQECFNEYFKLKNFNILERPVTNEKIKEEVEKLLDSENDYEEKDNNSFIETAEQKRKNILLVDDNATQLRMLKAMLNSKYDVQMATSGLKALTMIGKKTPDVILLDYEMPLCDGKMTLEMIREIDEAKSVPVVFLTGVRDKEHIEAVLKLKPAGYLLKPAKTELIFDTLEKIFEK